MATARFTPQVWVGDYAIEVPAEGPIEWEVGDVPEDMKDNSHESDELRFHGNAPEWVKDWDGPFYITITRETV